MRQILPAFLLISLLVPLSLSQTTPTTFFDMHINKLSTPWPSDSFSAVRLWGTNTTWGDVNTRQGVYDWTLIDSWLAAAKTHNVGILYTFGLTPTWASSKPGASCGPNPLGSCYPPDDLNSDGTGTDQHWKDFVTAIVTHSKNSATGHITDWEVWNEPNVTSQWQGTTTQLVQMAKDARAIILSIDPAAKVHSPAPTSGINGVYRWMESFLIAGGGAYVDVIDFHGYVHKNQAGVWPNAEDINLLVQNLQNTLAAHAVTLPIWNTEGSWGRTDVNGFNDQDLRAAFAARYLLLQQSKSVARVFWYQWDNTTHGMLWDNDQNLGCTTPDNTGFLCKAGAAYQQVYNWTVNRIIATACASDPKVITRWTCNYTGAGGFLGQAIWDTSKTCSNGTCTTVNVKVPTQYTKYTDIAGTVKTITNSTVPVGLKPIWLTNQ
jgi:polysaccharide biosynthesis protein PslG